MLAVLAVLSATRLPARAADGPVKESPDFHVVQATHYFVHTGIGDDPLVADLARRLDVMYDQYCLALSDFKPPADAPPFPVYLFDLEKNDLAFTDYAGKNTSGLFVGGPRSFLTSFLDANGRDQLRRTLQHEAFHQFAYFNVSRRLPIWLNEGLAQVFEEGIWTGRDFLLGQVPPHRTRQLQSDVKRHRLVPFDKVFHVTPEQWGNTLRHNLDDGNTEYGQAWAMAHFLKFGPDRAYHDRLAALLAKLHEDPAADLVDATTAALGDTPQFQRAFEAWASRLQPTPEATLLERQDTLGDFLPNARSEDHGATRSMTQFRDDVVAVGGAITYTHGAVKYTTVKPATVYFSGLDGRLYDGRQLFFEPARDAPLPDIVCRPNEAFVLRTHFYKGPKGTEHETSIAPTGRSRVRRQTPTAKGRSHQRRTSVTGVGVR